MYSIVSHSLASQPLQVWSTRLVGGGGGGGGSLCLLVLETPFSPVQPSPHGLPTSPARFQWLTSGGVVEEEDTQHHSGLLALVSGAPTQQSKTIPSHVT